MKKFSVKGEVLYNEAGGQVKVVSPSGQLSFPVHVIETSTPMRKRIRNYFELCSAVREMRRMKTIKAITKRMVIEERISMHMRALQV